MKVLFYGGCHASVFKRIFDKYALGEHEFDVLTNFVIIRNKTSFPYESLSQYDAVVFSPILNKEDWNTSNLEAACRMSGIKTFKFPWLQWAGYWPSATRRYWGRYQEWGMSMLYDMAAEHSDFESFYARLFSPQGFAEALPDWLDYTTERLRMNEKAGGVDIPIADWLLANHVKQRVFVTPDHAGTPLYKYLTQHISDALGLDIDPAFYSLSVQLQNDVLLPVLPGVAEALKLEFCAVEWAHSEFLGKEVYGLREFAMSYHDSIEIVLGHSTSATALKRSTSRAGPGDPRLKKGARLLFQYLGADARGHDRLATISGIGNENRSDERFIYTNHWRLIRPSIAPVAEDVAPAEQAPPTLVNEQENTPSTPKKRKGNLLTKFIQRLS